MVVAVDELEDPPDRAHRLVEADERRGELADDQRGAGAVAVMPLVAHLERLGEEAPHVERPVAVERLGEDRAEDLLHPAEPVNHGLVEGAVAEHLAEALVQGRVGGRAEGLVAEDHDGHRRRHDAGHRAHGPVVVAGLEADGPRGGERLGLLRGSSARPS